MCREKEIQKEFQGKRTIETERERKKLQIQREK